MDCSHLSKNKIGLNDLIFFSCWFVMENDDDENRFVAGNVLIFQTWHWTSCNGTYILCNVNAETTYRTALKQSVGRKRKKKKRWPDDSACLDKNSGAQQTSEFILCGTESMNQKSFQSLKSYQDELIIKVHHLGIIHICSKVVFQSIWWTLEYFLESEKFDLLVALDRTSGDHQSFLWFILWRP